MFREGTQMALIQRTVRGHMRCRWFWWESVDIWKVREARPSQSTRWWWGIWRPRDKVLQGIEVHYCEGNSQVESSQVCQEQDGVIAYSYLRRYYDLNGDKRVYGTSVLNEVLQLELHYNSPGGFDFYLSKFEEYCTQLDDCDQGLSEQQKHTFFFFLNRMLLLY